jgi:hypothetical protein
MLKLAIDVEIDEADLAVDESSNDDDVDKPETSTDDNKKQEDNSALPAPTNKEPAKEETAPQTEAQKRRKMINDELSKLIKDTEDNELQDDMEEEAKVALQKAANKICYLKKFYNVISDEVIYFPSVTKTIINYSLIEEAEKHYFEDEDEFPMEYSAALRSYATESIMGNDDEDDDDEYMEKLALDVEIDDGTEMDMLAETSDKMDTTPSATDDKTAPAEEPTPIPVPTEPVENEEKATKEESPAEISHDEDETDLLVALGEPIADEPIADDAEKDLNDSLIDFLDNALSDDDLDIMEDETEKEKAPEPEPAPAPVLSKSPAPTPKASGSKPSEKKTPPSSNAKPKASSDKKSTPPASTTSRNRGGTGVKKPTPQEKFLESKFSAKKTPAPKPKPAKTPSARKPTSTIPRRPVSTAKPTPKPRPAPKPTPKASSVASRSFARSTASTRSKPKSVPSSKPRPSSTHRSITTPGSLPSVAFKETASWSAHLGKGPSPESHESRHGRHGGLHAQPYSGVITPQALFSQGRSVRSSPSTARSRYPPPRNFGGTTDPNATSHSPTKRGPKGGRCDNLYQPYLHGDRGACELCYSKLSDSEQMAFMQRGRSLRVNMTTGGCDHSCMVFHRDHEEPPTRLCKTCFFNSHRESYQRLNPRQTLKRLP